MNNKWLMDFDSSPTREKSGEYNDYVLISVKCTIVTVFTTREVAINISRLAIGARILYSQKGQYAVRK